MKLEMKREALRSLNRQRLCQAGSGIQGRSSRIMALSATRSLRATAISVRPASAYRLRAGGRGRRRGGGHSAPAARAAMYNAFRTRGRPAAILRRPRNCPLSRASGARPANAAACRALSCPNSGRSASKAQQVLGPMPGAVRSCVARWHAAGCSRSACSTCCSQQRDFLAQRSDHPLRARQNRSALQLPLAGTLLGS